MWYSYLRHSINELKNATLWVFFHSCLKTKIIVQKHILMKSANEPVHSGTRGVHEKKMKNSLIMPCPVAKLSKGVGSTIFIYKKKINI